MYPSGERGIAAEGLYRTKRFEEGFLCEVFRGFDVLDTSVDVVVDAWLVFLDERVKGFGVAILGARDEVFFVKVWQ